MHVYIHMYICISVYIYIYISISISVSTSISVYKEQGRRDLPGRGGGPGEESRVNPNNPNPTFLYHSRQVSGVAMRWPHVGAQRGTGSRSAALQMELTAVT